MTTLLDKLWDDTVAGPLPDSGLGKLRKHYAFSYGRSGGNRSQRPPPPPSGDDVVKATRRSGGDDIQVQAEKRGTINTARAAGEEEEGGPFSLRKQMGLDPITLLLLTCDL